MADKKITQLTNITGANLVDADEFVVVDISADETKAITLGELKEAFDSGSGFVRITGDTMTGDLALSGADVTFGDNDKAIFGAGSDLQIYHDGTSSTSYFIESNATGNMEFRASSLRLKEGDGGNYYFLGVAGGASTIYHSGSAKLATTSTGIDVTGTVTADGLTVDSAVAILNLAGSGYGQVRNTQNTLILEGQGGDGLLLRTGGSSLKRQKIANNGDISFYEDTGTTAKFFWDASAESLGLGATSFAGETLRMERSGDMILGLFSGAANGTYLNMGTTANRDIGQISYTQSTNHMTFRTNDAERMRIDSSGNVGIGITPSVPLHVNGRVRVDGGSNDLDIYHNGSVAYIETTGGSATPIGFANSGTERMRIDSNGNVGIGTSSPIDYYSDNLVIAAAGEGGITIAGPTDGENYIMFADGTTGNNTYRGFIGYNHSSDHLRLGTSGTESMRIDSSGNLLVGKTAAATNVEGGELRENGQVLAVATNVNPFFGARLGSDGDIAVFRKDSTTVGSISCSNSGTYIYFGSSAGSVGLGYGAGFVFPTSGSTSGSDNAKDLGSPSYRWDDIYATNGTIQTSDEREKQDIRDITEAEARVAQACKGLLKAYRWIDAVAEKGDDARIHFGIIAQDLQDAFAAEGLDAGRYAMFISSTWWEATETYTDDDGVEQTRVNTYETAEEAPEGATERTRLGVRYPELLAFIIAAI